MNISQPVPTAYSFQLAQANQATPPQEPTILNKLSEAWSYLMELSSLQAAHRVALFGPEPNASQSEVKMESIEAFAGAICAQAACLVGEARTIQNRLK